MYATECRDLSGTWQNANREFDTLEAACDWCVTMSNSTGLAYRILLDGNPVDWVDLLEAGFEAGVNQGQDAESDRAETEDSGIPTDDDLGLPNGHKPPSDPADR